VDALGVDRAQESGNAVSADALEGAAPDPVPAVGGRTEVPNGSFGVDDPLAPFAPRPGGVGWWIVVAIGVAAVSGFGLRHVTSRHEIESALRFATRDPLTGLANRRLFEETLTREIARQRRKGTPLALALVDLDGFKHVNDTRGHAGGDEVLRSVGQTIVDRVRASDLPARIGGDEFAVVLPDCSPRDAVQVGEQLRAQIEAVVGPAVTASVGIAVVPDHADDADALVAAADAALYAAKEHGRNRAVMAADAAAPGSGPH
jgi:diguanylate cyclase (GGDEF)-like protein